MSFLAVDGTSPPIDGNKSCQMGRHDSSCFYKALNSFQRYGNSKAITPQLIIIVGMVVNVASSSIFIIRFRNVQYQKSC